MVNLTFADDADALDAALAAFTSELNKLTQVDPAGSGRPDIRTSNAGREKRHRESKRLIRSARHVQASHSAQRSRRPTHKEAIPSASRPRRSGRRPTVRGRLSRGSGLAPAQSGAALKAAIAWIRMRLARLGQAAGFELSENDGSD
jgi:hypothetical protein